MQRILVVDDEKALLSLLVRILEVTGYSVDSALNYDDAVQKFDSEPFDLVLTDIVLGGKTGIDLLHYIKQSSPRCPVIMITGAPSVESASAAVRLGADNYLIKPFSNDVLVNSVSISLKNSLMRENADKYKSNLDAIFRSVRDAIITVDADMKVTELNSACKGMFGLSRDVIGMPLEDLGLFSSTRGLDIMAKTIDQRLPFELTRVECQAKGGKQMLVIVSTSPLTCSEGEHLGAVLVIRDETRLMELEKMLSERSSLHHMIGHNKAMQEIFELIETLSNVDTTVLVLGESGTGKELVADAMHFVGNRREAPLVKVNCSALSESLLESELFGHVKGSFTGAVSNRIGRFEAAEGGTIFLDEIGDITPALQVKLLRVLQEKVIERVGEMQPRSVDVRVIAATNKDLHRMVTKGQFREDLYYRLKVVEMNIPALRDRSEDIPLLMEAFIQEFNEKFQKNIEGISDDVMEFIINHDWPGNIREFKHTLEHAAILCRSSIISMMDLPTGYRRSIRPVAHSIKDEETKVLNALRDAGWNKAKAARGLGVSRQTLYNKITQFGIIEA